MLNGSPRKVVFNIICILLIGIYILYKLLGFIMPYGAEGEDIVYPIGSGKIQFFGNDSQILNCETGEVTEIHWRDGLGALTVKYLCPSHRQGIILMGNRFLDRENPVFGANIYTVTPLYYYTLFDSVYSDTDSLFEFVGALESFNYNCKSLDYCDDLKSYLYSGKYDGKYGIFLLDTLFNVVSDISGFFPLGYRGYKGISCRFLDNEHAISDNSERIHIVNIDNGNNRTIAEGKLLCTSNSGEFIVYVEDDQNLRLMNIKTHEKTGIDRNIQFCDGVFSPDGKYILYSKVMDTFVSTATPDYIYDIEKHSIFRIGTHNNMWFSNSFIWVN